jgi:hypothetical protein
MKLNVTFFLLFSSLLFIPANHLHSQDTLSLAGKWKITIDGNFKDWPRKIGEQEKWYQSELPSNYSNKLLNDLYFKNANYKLNDWINLPGSTDEAQIGITLVESEPFTIGLERKISYDGAFWVQREVTIPQNWQGKTVYFLMERLLIGSKVYWDGNYIGEDYGLGYPHKFLIDSTISVGEHTITVLINKDDLRYQQYGHHVVNGNGISWNGIVGRIELIARNSNCHINNVLIFPDISSKSIDVNLQLAINKIKNGKVVFSLRKKSEKSFKVLKTIKFDESNLNLKTDLSIPEPIDLWSEFSPNLYELKSEIKVGDEIFDSQISTFGMREISTSGGNITINGNKIFVRGTLDNNVSPLKGYPDTKKEDWLRKLGIIKSYGINLIRFHTNCPPETAFEAADELGLYFQVELSGSPYSELNRILDTYGNHPSFCMLSLNNEAFSHNEQTKKVILDAKEKDNRHLYTCTTHPVKPDCVDDFYVSAWGNYPINEWPNYNKIVGITWGGGDNVTACRFNTISPNTTYDYRKDLKGINAPIISHEVGQWVMYPNYSEIDKYTGALRNTNYERFKKLFEINHSIELADDFAEASGKFSALLYKEEIESALRTPDFGGFELLGLRDYQGQWTAIVGVLDIFTESKGIIIPDEHRKYCNAIVPLARLEKRIFYNNEKLSFDVVIANYSFNDLRNQTPEWQLLDDDGGIIHKGKFNTCDIKKGKLTEFQKTEIGFQKINKPSKLVLKVMIPDSEIENTWDIWVYPSEKFTDKSNVKIITANQINQLEDLLSKGEKVLLILGKSDLKDSRESCFATIFWNSLFKWPQKSHTLGIYCDPKHPAFNEFPTDNHSNWQWWDIAMNANAVNLNSFSIEFEPIINVIDSYHLGNKLAYLFECKIGDGKLLVSTIDLLNNLEERPASKQLKESLLNYMGNDLFDPKVTLNIDSIYDFIINNNLQLK